MSRFAYTLEKEINPRGYYKCISCCCTGISFYELWLGYGHDRVASHSMVGASKFNMIALLRFIATKSTISSAIYACGIIIIKRYVIYI